MHADHAITQTNWYRFWSWFFGPKTWKVRSRKAYQDQFQNSHSEKKPKELAPNHPTGSWLRTRFLRPICFPQSIADSLSHWEQVFFELSIPIFLPRYRWRPRTPKPFEVGRELLICVCVKVPFPILLNCWPQIGFGSAFLSESKKYLVETQEVETQTMKISSNISLKTTHLGK